MPLRVIGPEEGYTRPVRSMVGATERARRVALLAGSAEIQQREKGKEWVTLEKYRKVGYRVERSR